MKIAIVAPSPVPFQVGGAEKLWWGMLTYLNSQTNHQCELIKIPIREDNFWNLIESYYKFYQLDLSSFDLVITTKYPAWMVRHSNHHLYLQHCLRGLYDTYHFTHLPTEIHSRHSKIKRLLEAMEHPKEIYLNDFFESLFEMRQDDRIEEELFRFPGPFIRKIIHFLDKKAMENITFFSAISRTVTQRKEYFPSHAHVKVVNHPSNLTTFKNHSYDYFFTPSRLDAPKRVRMIVEAYLRAKTDIPLKVAGKGPLEQELRDLSRHDQRIEFLGFISDQELIECYARAYAVIFIPYDEDYGLVTIEAMMSEKPVITFRDSGGVTEFVENGKTGYVCEPDVNRLTEIMEQVSKEGKNALIQMGKNGRKRVESIQWAELMRELIDAPKCLPSTQKQRKISVVSTYPIYPPRGGGQNRVYYLFRELAKSMKVEVISLVNASERPLRQQIAPGFLEIRIPKSKSHARKEWQIEKRVGIPVTDIAMLYLYEETRGFVDATQQSLRDSEYIICAHPYTFLLIKKVARNNIIYDSHNVEYLLKRQMLPQNEYSEQLLDKVFETEKRACLESCFTNVCSGEDGKRLQELYGLDPDKIVEVPNGVDLGGIPFTTPKERLENKRGLGIGDIPLALFIGSWHQPNIEAVYHIFKFAEELPHVKFLVLGSVGFYFREKIFPKNVGFMGVVDDEEKNYVLSLADVAINPIIAGSGTNMKMLDYLAAGVPVVSTPTGARGLEIPTHFLTLCDIDQFCDHLFKPVEEKILWEAKSFIEKNYSWRDIAERLRAKILSHGEKRE
jgi:glycosyltransferase involved in cell wall biosynthesis